MKKTPLSDKRKKTIFAVILVFSIFFISYGLYNFMKLRPTDGQKVTLKQDTGDRPLPKDVVVYVNADNGLNLRKDRDANSQKLALVPNGTKLTVTQELEGWYKVNYNNKEGWISKSFTTQDVPVAQSDQYKDWTTFSSPSGYKIKYEPGWRVKDYGQNTANKASSMVAFSNQDLPDTVPDGSEFIAPIVVRVTTQNLNDAQNNYSTIGGVTSEKINVGSLSGTKYVYTSTYSNTQVTAIVVGSGSKVFILTEAGGYQDDLLNMIKTFSLGA